MYKELKRKFNALPLIVRSILIGVVLVVLVLVTVALISLLTNTPLRPGNLMSLVLLGGINGVNAFVREAEMSEVRKSLIFFIGNWIFTFLWFSTSNITNESWLVNAGASFIFSLFFSGIRYLVLGFSDKS